MDVISGVKSVYIAFGKDRNHRMASNRVTFSESRRGKTGLLQPSIVIPNNRIVLVDAIWDSTYFNKQNTVKIFAFGLNILCQLPSWN